MSTMYVTLVVMTVDLNSNDIFAVMYTSVVACYMTKSLLHYYTDYGFIITIFV